jgi:hypothetical protein
MPQAAEHVQDDRVAAIAVEIEERGKRAADAVREPRLQSLASPVMSRLHRVLRHPQDVRRLRDAEMLD